MRPELTETIYRAAAIKVQVVSPETSAKGTYAYPQFWPTPWGHGLDRPHASACPMPGGGLGMVAALTLSERLAGWTRPRPSGPPAYWRLWPLTIPAGLNPEP